MLPGPTNVPERVTRAMVTPSINHRSDDFVELYEECVDNTKKIFETEGDAVCLSASGTGATECSVVNLIKKDDRSEEHTSELQSLVNLVCRLLLEKKKKKLH